MGIDLEMGDVDPDETDLSDLDPDDTLHVPWAGVHGIVRAMQETGMLAPDRPGPDLTVLDEDSEVYRAALAATHDPSAGIATHKLETNDGWHVTSDETSAALAAWDGSSEAVRDRLLVEVPDLAEWLAFLRRAVPRDGVRVW